MILVDPGWRTIVLDSEVYVAAVGVAESDNRVHELGVGKPARLEFAVFVPLELAFELDLYGLPEGYFALRRHCLPFEATFSIGRIIVQCWDTVPTRMGQCPNVAPIEL